MVVEAVEGLNTLIDFRYQQHFFARNGRGGQGSQRTGADGGDIVLYERIPRVKLPPPRLPASGGDGASAPDAEGVGAKKKKRRSHRGGKRGWQMWVAKMKRRMAIEDAAAAAGMATMSA